MSECLPGPLVSVSRYSTIEGAPPWCWKNVPLEPHTTQLLILLLAPGVVLHVPQVIPTVLLIPVPLQEPLLVLEAQHHGKNNQQLLDNLLVDSFRKCFYCAPVLPHDVRVWAAGV